MYMNPSAPSYDEEVASYVSMLQRIGEVAGYGL
jgi:hypothetical protein